MIEYVIWGITPASKHEQILLTAVKGNPITDLALAEQWKERLTDVHNCTDVRIQEIDLSDNNLINSFINSIN